MQTARLAPPSVLLVILLSTGACTPSEAPAARAAAAAAAKQAVRAEIEAQIALGLAATRDEDIDAYMAGLPGDLVIYDESGAVITREQQRAYVLRDWAVITRTLHIAMAVDSLSLSGDTLATAFTAQRWKRMMRRPDRPGEDTVLTTQRHRETWRPTPDGWRLYEVEELGGTVLINGVPYPRP